MIGSPCLALGQSQQYPAQYIVKYKAGVSAEGKAKVINEHALQKRQDLQIINAQLVSPAGSFRAQSQSSLLEEIAKDPAVEYVEPDYCLYPMGTPISQDADASLLWGLKNYGQSIDGNVGVAEVDINLEGVWQVTEGNPEVLVAIIDTGIDIRHPDLSHSIWINQGEIPDNGVDDDNNGLIDDLNGWDFVHDDKSVYDSASEDAHGTHCAGIISAAHDLLGVVGVAPGVKILPLKFMNASGGSTSDAISAIEYAARAGAKIVNCSWGGSDSSQALQDAIGGSDMIFVTAAGNVDSGESPKDIDDFPLYPASFDLDNIIAVAAVDNMGNLTSFSNYGYNSVDVAAPGKSIYSTRPDNKYGFLNGTSMATPYVSGVAALLASTGINDNALIKQRILDSAVHNPLSSLSNKILTGGMVDALEALGINLAPTASDLSISGSLYPGEVLQGKYIYHDANQDPEGNSRFEWYRADSAQQDNLIEIPGANLLQYTIKSEDIGKYLCFGLIPEASSGLTPGDLVLSDAVGPVEAGPLISLHLLDGSNDLLSDFRPEQIDYQLNIDDSLSSLALTYTGTAQSSVSVYYNQLLQTEDQISLDPEGDTISIMVQTPGIADRCYTIELYRNSIDQCFIATAAFGSKYEPAVVLLRAFRDQHLLTNNIGRSMVALYYHYSPPLAQYIADKEGLRVIVKILLTPVILAVYLILHQWLLLIIILLTFLLALRLSRIRKQRV
jgi:subtilisin family serine protease